MPDVEKTEWAYPWESLGLGDHHYRFSPHLEPLMSVSQKITCAILETPVTYQQGL